MENEDSGLNRSPQSPEYGRRSREDGSRSAELRRSPSPHSRSDAPALTEVSPSNIIGVFGLHPDTREGDLERVYSEHGKILACKLVFDRRSNQSRGFGFITFETIDEAKKALEATAGMSLMGRTIRVDYSKTERAHSPTPGKYMGTRPRDYNDRRERPSRGYHRENYRYDRRDYDRRDYDRYDRYERRDYDRRPDYRRDDAYYRGAPPPPPPSNAYDGYDRAPRSRSPPRYYR